MDGHAALVARHQHPSFCRGTFENVGSGETRESSLVRTLEIDGGFAKPYALNYRVFQARNRTLTVWVCSIPRGPVGAGSRVPGCLHSGARLIPESFALLPRGIAEPRSHDR